MSHPAQAVVVTTESDTPPQISARPPEVARMQLLLVLGGRQTRPNPGFPTSAANEFSQVKVLSATE